VLLRFWQANLPVNYRGVQHDRGPTGNLDLHERKGSRRGPKYPKRTSLAKGPTNRHSSRFCS